MACFIEGLSKQGELNQLQSRLSAGCDIWKPLVDSCKHVRLQACAGIGRAWVTVVALAVSLSSLPGRP
jgi:hypothetical protein